MAYYSTNESALVEVVTGTSMTYSIADLCGAPATTDGWVEPGNLHTALMTGLKPSTRYFYKYGEVREQNNLLSYERLSRGPDNDTCRLILQAAVSPS